jgi:hypothetical protein
MRSCKSYLIEQVRQYLISISVPMQSQEVGFPEVDKLMSNDSKENTKFSWYPNIAAWELNQETLMEDDRD